MNRGQIDIGGLTVFLFLFFKQKTAYEMRISDWSSDVCSSDLRDVDERVLAEHRVETPGGKGQRARLDQPEVDTVGDAGFLGETPPALEKLRLDVDGGHPRALVARQHDSGTAGATADIEHLPVLKIEPTHDRTNLLRSARREE